MMTNPAWATRTPRRAQLCLSAKLHSIPPKVRSRIRQPRALSNSATSTANVGRIAVGLEALVERHFLDAYRPQRRQPSRDNSLERADRQREQNQTDDSHVPRRVINVVEVQTQYRPGNRRGVVLKVKIGFFVLIDDDPDEREQAPRDEKRDREEHVAERAHEITINRSCCGHRAVLSFSKAHRRWSGSITQIEISYSAYIGNASNAMVSGLPSGAAMPPATKKAKIA